MVSPAARVPVKLMSETAVGDMLVTGVVAEEEHDDSSQLSAPREGPTAVNTATLQTEGSSFDHSELSDTLPASPTSDVPAEASPPGAAAPASPKKKRAPLPPPNLSPALSPALRRQLRRAGMSPPRTKEAPRRKVHAAAGADGAGADGAETAAQRRRSMAFFNKTPGYTVQDLHLHRSINLINCSLLDEDLGYLASLLQPQMVQLKELELVGNKLHDAAMQAIAGAISRGAVPMLTCLHVGRNAIGDDGLRALAEAFGEGALPRLETLMLVHNKISADGVAALSQAAESGALAALACLGLSGNEIGTHGLKSLASAASDDEVLAKLAELHLVSIGATEEGLGALAETLMPKVGGLPALRLLRLDEAHLGHARLKEAHVARNGLGGVHSFKLLAS